MKSDSGSPKQVHKWRLSRTLKRNTNYRPIEADDVKYAWAAYKKGVFKELFPDDLPADEFKKQFEIWVLDNVNAAWTLKAHTKNGFIPVGMVFAYSGSGSFMIVKGMVWFPWASKRNMLEAIVGFLNGVRKEFPLMFFAKPEHKRMYEVCAKHGVIGRVGTSNNVFAGERAAVWETRAA